MAKGIVIRLADAMSEAIKAPHPFKQVANAQMLEHTLGMTALAIAQHRKAVACCNQSLKLALQRRVRRDDRKVNTSFVHKVRNQVRRNAKEFLNPFKGTTVLEVVAYNAYLKGPMGYALLWSHR